MAVTKWYAIEDSGEICTDNLIGTKGTQAEVMGWIMADVVEHLRYTAEQLRSTADVLLTLMGYNDRDESGHIYDDQHGLHYWWGPLHDTGAKYLIVSLRDYDWGDVLAEFRTKKAALTYAKAFLSDEQSAIREVLSDTVEDNRWFRIVEV